MFESGLPIGIGVHQMEFIGAFEMFVRVFLSQTTAISAQALSKATGSNDASIPKSGIMAASL